MFARLHKVAIAAFVVVVCLPVGARAQQASKRTDQTATPRRAVKLPPPLGPSQIILFKIKVAESSKADLETFFKSEVLPSLIKSSKIRAVKTYAKLVGGDFTYIAQVEIKPGVPLTFGTVVDILSNGRTAQDTNATINRLAGFFGESSSSLVLYRPDLSISRDGLGYVTTKERTP
jgi:hypothetical protein